jgi:hypothetical protein
LLLTVSRLRQQSADSLFCSLLEISIRLIHQSHELAMELFPGDRHRFSGLQVFHSASYFLVPSLLDRLIRRFQAIEQGVSQSGALVDREGESPS